VLLRRSNPCCHCTHGFNRLSAALQLLSGIEGVEKLAFFYIKMLLDELFPNFGLVRKEVEDMEEELSESDPDY